RISMWIDTMHERERRRREDGRGFIACKDYTRQFPERLRQGLQYGLRKGRDPRTVIPVLAGVAQIKHQLNHPARVTAHQSFYQFIVEAARMAGEAFHGCRPKAGIGVARDHPLQQFRSKPVVPSRRRQPPETLLVRAAKALLRQSSEFSLVAFA